MSSSHRQILVRTSAVTAATLGSRLLGFARDVGTAAVLGAGPLADALMAALALPLLARRLLAEGAFNAALLPALATAGGDSAAAARANATLLLLCLILMGFAVLGALAMPALILLLAPGFDPGGPRADLAAACGRIALFYLPLAGAAAVLGGIANAAHRVFLPALAPALGNAVVLFAIAALIFEGLVGTPQAALVMAGCAVLAGVAQLALMAAAAWGAPAARWRTGYDFPAAWRVLHAAVPALLFAGLPQVRLLLAAAAVSAVPGAVAGLNYAQRLVDLPLGLVGASAGAVLVPLLTIGASGTQGAAGATRDAALAALAFALPAATGLCLLADPIIAVLYQRASFTSEDAQATGRLLAALALALPAQGLEKVLGAAAISNGLTRPARQVGLVSLACALPLAFGLGQAFGPVGAAASVAVSAGISVVGMAGFLALRRRLALVDAVRPGLALLAASAVMAGAVLALEAAWPDPGAGLAPALRLGALVAAGMATYGAAWLALRRVGRTRPSPSEPGGNGRIG
ncbi:lipid II flippase MurJ [Aquabacter spiritensis]|uniref:Putative peptidoglycan lipid II flippase n=1 Tax=Aquabacter spiritensis TaxID=933073 RepID=A0A4R3LRB0_9HYPH|nr:lipid II flippase MurJ [Aquabacter spiritensis]TCT01065.1 putative peptidoglycan lipid II flippase [Aquabacter spiritensis]